MSFRVKVSIKFTQIALTKCTGLHRYHWEGFFNFRVKLTQHSSRSYKSYLLTLALSPPAGLNNYIQLFLVGEGEGGGRGVAYQTQRPGKTNDSFKESEGSRLDETNVKYLREVYHTNWFFWGALTKCGKTVVVKAREYDLDHNLLPQEYTFAELFHAIR